MQENGLASGKYLKGRTLSEEHKKALRKSNAKGTKPRPSPSKETRKKISNSMRVMKTPEARKKHSEIMKERWAKRKRGEVG